MNRRNFLKGFGVLGTLVASPSIANYATNTQIQNDEFEKDLDNNTDISIRSHRKEVMRLDSTGNLGIGFVPNYNENYNEVKLTVGVDGNLYVKENHKWRRI